MRQLLHGSTWNSFAYSQTVLTFYLQRSTKKKQTKQKQNLAMFLFVAKPVRNWVSPAK